MMGLGIGFMLAPLWADFLMRTYGWRGGLLVHAGVALNGCVVAMFLWTPKRFCHSSRKPSSRHGVRKQRVSPVVPNGGHRFWLAEGTGVSPIGHCQFAVQILVGGFHQAYNSQGPGRWLLSDASCFAVYCLRHWADGSTGTPGWVADWKRVNRTILLGGMIVSSGLIAGCLTLPEKYGGYVALAALFGVTIGRRLFV